MQKISIARRVSQIFLWLVPLLPVLGSAYQPGGLNRYAVVGAGAIQAVLMGAAAWILAGEAIKSHAPERQALLVPGVLLMACWASAGLALNMGPPPRGPAWLATTADQHFRYTVLFVGGILAFGAFANLIQQLMKP